MIPRRLARPRPSVRVVSVGGPHSERSAARGVDLGQDPCFGIANPPGEAMKDTLAVVCLVIAIALAAADVLLALLTALKTKEASVQDLGLPGGEVIKTLADKAPRLAAAFAFMVLAGIFSGDLHFEANAGSDDSGSGSTPTEQTD